MICLRCAQEITKPSQSKYGLHEACFTAWFCLSEPADFISLQQRSSVSADNAKLSPENTSFFHGKFKKYSAELNGESYILKMRQDGALELPEVEYLCNQIGKSLDIPVAEFYLIDFNGDKTFVTKNFIKAGSSPTDLQHIYHFREDTKHNCEHLIEVIKDRTQKPHHVAIFVKTILFDALIGNHDRHGRNLAFIRTSSGISVSPIYDNVSYLMLESGKMLKADFNPTGRISTSQTNEPSMKDYVREFIRLGYHDEVDEFQKKINTKLISQLINNSFCSPAMKEAITALIFKRIKELENELST